MEVSEIWQVFETTDELANDSDKSFTIPAANEWQILGIYVDLTTTANVGDRQLELRITNAAGIVVARYVTSVIQAASLNRTYLFAPACNELLGFRDTDYLSTTISTGSIFQAGDVIRIYDNNAIQPAADDMLVRIRYAGRSVN
jgi:hypothetical protein